jgi:hypothetical protein
MSQDIHDATAAMASLIEIPILHVAHESKDVQEEWLLSTDGVVHASRCNKNRKGIYDQG